MELRPLPLPLFNLFAERGQSFLFRHIFPSDYSLEACWPGLYSRFDGFASRFRCVVVTAPAPGVADLLFAFRQVAER